jgi:excisionase family DNA binding protein
MQAESRNVTPEYLPPAQIAALCSRSRSWVDKLIRSGKLPVHRIGLRNVLVRRSDFEKFLESHRVDPSVPAPHESKPRHRGANGKFVPKREEVR